MSPATDDSEKEFLLRRCVGKSAAKAQIRKFLLCQANLDSRKVKLFGHVTP
jgi:hypothetical protein